MTLRGGAESVTEEVIFLRHHCFQMWSNGTVLLLLLLQKKEHTFSENEVFREK